VLLDAKPSEEISKDLQNAGVNALVLPMPQRAKNLKSSTPNSARRSRAVKRDMQKAKKPARYLQAHGRYQPLNPKHDVVITACYLYDIGRAATSDTLAGKIFDYTGAVNCAQSTTGGDFSAESLNFQTPTLFCAHTA
jgi:hypothetical protein